MTTSYSNPIKDNSEPYFGIFDLHRLCEQERQANQKEHKHEYYSVYFLTDGEVKYNTLYSEYNLTKKHLLFVSSGVPHKMFLDDDVKGYSIIFNELFWNQFNKNELFPLPDLFNREDFKTVLTINKAEHDQFLNYIDELKTEWLENEFGKQQLLHHYLFILLLKAFRKLSAQAEIENQDETNQHAVTIINFKKLVDKNYQSAKSVSTYANQLNINPNCLNEISKHITGQTAGEIIRTKVLNEAQKLLFTTSLSFKEVAFRLGFDDPAYFSRYFKKHTGKTLSNFKSNVKNLSK